ncbi:glycoside hydrolase family 16 protein [Nocardioides sp. LHG3406-4]|uniref:glycoside hydrolase family 16 protein n=1 Tax=Nocardioides sp. LHG3406-4 TaxID=2804575 RepID=UPI003CE6D76D
MAALLMPASLLLASQANSETEPPAPSSLATKAQAQKAKTRVAIQVMPQISQYGKKAASPGSARAAVTVKVKPQRPGTKVLLQVKAGSAWKKAGKAVTSKKGVANFNTAATRSGKPVTLRAKVGKVATKPVSNAKWITPLFSDGFDGTTLGTQWSHRIPDYNPEGFRACSKGGPEAVRVGGGTVRLSVIKDPTRSDLCTAKQDGRVLGKYAYRLNGHISTEDQVSFKYGFAAARMKFQKMRGQHASFWLQPDTEVPGGAEIDVIEWFGKGAAQGGLTSFTYHRDSKGKLIKTGDWIKDSEKFLANKKDDWFKAYHVFSVEWTPSAYIFRIDGKETYRSTKGISNQPEFPILSLLSSDYEIPNIGSDSKLPQHSYVDWVRIWQS